MVSNMREWCDQSNSQPCKYCGGIGAIEVLDYLNVPKDAFMDPLSGIWYYLCKCNKSKDIHISQRKKWDDIWMNLALDIATRSTCKVPNRQVGCVIVSDDNTKVLSNGYNGSAKGDDNSCEYSGDNSKKIGESRCNCVHAEMNALVKLDTSNPCKKRMYLTLSPCSLCYKLIVNAGIDELIYDEEYSFIQLEKLRDLGVKVRKYA